MQRVREKDANGVIKLVSSMVDRIDMDADESGIFGLQAVESVKTLAANIESDDADCSAEVLETAVRFIKSSAMDKVIKNEHMTTSMKHLLENANNICDTEYIAKNEDILRFREPTKQMDFLEYDIEDRAKLVMHDFGGHRALRESWLKFATDNKDNVKVIIFVLALDSYLEDCNDAVGNKMFESFHLLKMLSEMYERPIVVFLNKVDLLPSALEKNADLRSQSVAVQRRNKHRQSIALQRRR